MSINYKIKNKAISMRMSGKSYSEILNEVPVAKSTLSLWLREIGLSKVQVQQLTKKRLVAARRGGESRRSKRLADTRIIEGDAQNEIGRISQRELFLIGVALYWAEGSKQKPHNLSTPVTFSNSDPAMLTLYLRWLNLLKIPGRDISFSIYLHDSAAIRTENVRLFWSKTLKLSITKLEKVYFKKGHITTFRKNTGIEYNGQIRVRVARSTNLNRRITGWVMGICNSS